jgi:hypothetical protein
MSDEAMGPLGAQMREVTFPDQSRGIILVNAGPHRTWPMGWPHACGPSCPKVRDDGRRRAAVVHGTSMLSGCAVVRGAGRW